MAHALVRIEPPTRPARLRSLRGSGLLAAWFLLAAACIGEPARAADFSVGVAGGVDHGKVDCVAAFDCDHSGSQAKIFVGYRWNDAVDLQALYFDAGHFKGGDLAPVSGAPFGGTFKVSGFGVSAGYRWQFGQDWSAVTRGGFASVRPRFDYADDLAGSVSKTLVEPLASVGVAYAITPQWRLGIDYDVTRFKVHNSHGPLQMVGVAAEYAF